MAFAPTAPMHANKPAGRGTGRSATHLSAWLWIATMTLSTVCSVALVNHPLLAQKPGSAINTTTR